MSLLPKIRNWWDAITQRARVHQDVECEFQFHIDAYAEDLIRNGMPETEARRTARFELGRTDTQKEKYRESIGLRVFDEVGSDLRLGLRSLWNQPVFSSVAILSLALGIGTTTAMFSLIYAVLIHPFPYSDSERIMNPVIINEERPQELRWFAVTKSQFEAFRHAQSVQELLGFRNVNMELTGKELPEDVAAIYLTENAGTFFVVPAFLGRGIQASDANGGGQLIAVLNYRFWQRHFQGNWAVIGSIIQLDHANYTIVGVMPRTFAFNDTLGVGDVYLPRSLLHDSINPPIAWPYTPWIKLKSNVSHEAANAELGAMVRQFAKDFPARYPRKFHLQLQPIIVPFESNISRALRMLFAGVLLLLLIGCANCTILLLARGKARQHELAVRRALGASRWRIVRQLLVESLVVAFSGALLGVVSSYWLARLPLQLSPASFPAESVIRINLPVLLFSVALAVMCGFLFGLFPALRLSDPDLSQTIQSRIRGVAGPGGRRRLNPLIAGQVALTLLLMATAGTAIHAFLHLTELPLGFEPANVMQAGIVMHWNDPIEWGNIKSQAQRAAFINQVRQRIASVPGVLSVAVGSDSTPPYSGFERAFNLLSKRSNEERNARIHFVSPEYFATLRIPLLRGRIWDETENTRGDFVAEVNESFAQDYWPGESAIGEQIRIPGLKPIGPLMAASPESTGWRQIIGVVGDARDDGIDRPVVPAIYVPYSTLMAPYAQFEIRTRGEPLALLHSIRTAVQSVSSDQQVANGAIDLKEAIERDAQWSRQRLFSILFGLFSAIALVLALVGLFSVVSYSVAQRTMEFGIRLAMGASRSHILLLAARAALVSSIGGVAAGLSVDLLVGRILAKWMSSGAPAFATLVDVTLLLTLCALAACLLPARRAASIHPIEALRYE